MTSLWILAAAYALVINTLTWVAFWADKERARQGRHRIPERTLLVLALLGGSPAALHAQQRLRHKTRKQPFALLLMGIPVLQVAVLLGIALMMA